MNQFSRNKLRIFDIILYSYPTPDPSIDKESLFWDESRIMSHKALYASDAIKKINLFTTDIWNLHNLEQYNILRHAESLKDGPMYGITVPYVYFGSWGTFFPKHAEDMDTHSLNFLHFGASKIW